MAISGRTSSYYTSTTDGWTSTTAGCTTAATAWIEWTSNAIETSTSLTWTTWACSSSYVPGKVYYTTAGDDGSFSVSPPHEPTPEELEAQRLAAEQAERERAERALKTRKASRAALKLLYQIIGPKAYAAFRRRKYHEIIAHSGRRYRLAVGQRVREMMGNFGDQVAAYYCIVTEYQYGLPAEDVLVQQLLLLMAGEQGEALLLKTANKGAA